MTQQPAVSDWSEAVAEEEKDQQGYYTDSMLNGGGRPRGRGGWSRGRRGGPQYGSQKDLGRWSTPTHLPVNSF